MRELYEFYENTLGSVGFYYELAYKIDANPGLYNEHLLLDYTNGKANQDNSDIVVVRGDIRFDMPIAIGNSSAKERILILGLEPRHTDDFFNLMRVGNRVFATPFGIDRWYSKSRKGNYYGTAFAEFLLIIVFFSSLILLKNIKFLIQTIKNKILKMLGRVLKIYSKTPTKVSLRGKFLFLSQH